MALDTLANIADLPDEWISDASYTALAIASSLVRDAAGCAISQTTSTVVVIGTQANLLPLPGPVSTVSSVVINDCTVTDYEVLPSGLWRHCGWGCGMSPQRVTVAYTGGLAEVPADIVDLTANLAIAWLQHQAAGGGSTAGLSQVALDDAHESYTDEAAAQITPVYIPEATRDWLGRRFGGSVAVVETL